MSAFTPKLTGGKIAERVKELREMKSKVCEIWLRNKSRSPSDLRKFLHQEGYALARSTLEGWIKRWREGKGLPITTEEKSIKVAVAVEEAIIKPVGHTYTYEDIVKTAPSWEALGSILLAGVEGRIKDLEEKINQMTLKIATLVSENQRLQDEKKQLSEAYQRVTAEYNEQLLKHRYQGKLTLDQAKHVLIPKSH